MAVSSRQRRSKYHQMKMSVQNLAAASKVDTVLEPSLIKLTSTRNEKEMSFRGIKYLSIKQG